MSEHQSVPNLALTRDWLWPDEPSIPVEAHGTHKRGNCAAWIYKLTGCANAHAWKGFPADTLLLMGINAARQEDGTWDAKAHFSYRPSGWQFDDNMVARCEPDGSLRRIPLEIRKLVDFSPLDGFELDDWTPEDGAEIAYCGYRDEERLSISMPGRLIVGAKIFRCKRCWMERKGPQCHLARTE